MAEQLNIPKELLSPSDTFMEAMSSMDFYWWYWDNSNKHLILSPQLKEVLGIAEGDFDPSRPTLGENIHPEDRKTNDALFRDFLLGETEAYEMEYRLKTKVSWKWYYNRGTVISKDSEGRPTFVGGITMNISDRYGHLLKRVEESRKFEFIFKNTSEAVMIVTMGDDQAPGEVTQVNRAACDIFKCSEKDLIGKNPYDLLKAGAQAERDLMRGALLSQGYLHLDIETKNMAGERIFLDVSSHAFMLTGENILISVIKDVTETAGYQRELKASEVALRKSEGIYRTVIQSANDRIGLFDMTGKIVIINDAFAGALGYTKEEFADLDNRNRIHPDDIATLEKQQKLLLKNGQIETEYRVLHRDGHYLNMLSKAVVVKDAGLEEEYILFIIRDITKDVMSQRELIEAKEKAIESGELKSAFLANMSHEIRTPMNSIVGFANLLLEEDVSQDEREEYVKRINKNSEQLLALISDIIDLAKIESNQLSVRYASIRLNNVIIELSQYAEQLLITKGKKKIKVFNDPDPNYPDLMIETDLVRLTQIIQNLLNNAIKFTEEGKVTIGYRMCNRNSVNLFVEDTGIGIDKKYHRIIFDQFRQVDGSNIRRFGGTGLGLAICKNLTTLMKGRIWVVSEPGKGSTFNVELPVRSNKKVDSLRTEKKKRKEIPESIHVMMVDDDPDSLMLVTTMMRNEGLQITTAESGYKALELLERGNIPDVVLMDLQMPVLDGVQTLAIIKEQYPGVKVIAQSAYALQGDRERSLDNGFDDHLSKPISKNTLMDALQNVLI